ncbi:hypothetical protein Bca101_092576 [Brassica carinata]
MSEINYNCSLRDNNLKVLQGYGLTETTAIVASMFTEEETERYRSSGLLSPNVEAKIVDQERVVSWGLIKLANSGSGVISKTKKATASTIDSEGWLKTGDVCYINSEGFVFAVSPYKRICKVSHGFVFDPRESHWQDFKKRTYKAHNHKALAGSCVHQPYLRLHH